MRTNVATATTRGQEQPLVLAERRVRLSGRDLLAVEAVQDLRGHTTVTVRVEQPPDHVPVTFTFLPSSLRDVARAFSLVAGALGIRA